MENGERCVCCGEIIPEGRMVCPNCEVGNEAKQTIPLRRRIIYAGDVFNSLMAEKGWSVTEASEFMRAFREADAVEVVHGRWEKHGKHDWRCSACKIGVPYSYTGNHYCHNCGAKMDNRKDNLEWKYTPKANAIDFDYEAED